MDCNYIKDKLVDYIDGLLSNKEEKEIFNHLQNCENCRLECEELQSTIDYIVHNTKKIYISKGISLNTKTINKKTVRFTKTALIAALLSISLVVTVFAATDVLDFLKWWEKSSELYMNEWEKLIESGVGEKLNISAIDKDIRVTAEGVIADELNTLIILKVENLKEDIKLTPLKHNEFNYPISLSIDGDISADSIGDGLNYVNLYSKADNTIRLLLMTDPIKKNEGIIEVNITNLYSFINNNTEDIINIDGNWELSIPVNVIKSKNYDLKKTIDLYGMELIIDRVEIAATVTSINYRIKNNKEDNRIADKITFFIEYDSKVYDDSELTALYNFNKNKDGDIEGAAYLDSLYLQDPDNIDIIVETLRYKVENLQIYDIDTENIPQVLEYNGNYITIEDIVYNDDGTELIISEDNSNDREYLKTIFDIEEDNDKKLDRTIESLEWITMDNNGVIEDEDLKGKFWNNKMYNYFLNWKITVSNNDYNKQVHGNSEKLILKKLYIMGQDYIEFPNINIEVDLR